MALRVMDKTLTPSPWTTLMDYPNGLPKWTTLKWVYAGFATCRVRYVRVRYMFATRITKFAT